MRSIDDEALRASYPGATNQVYLDVAAVGILSTRSVLAMVDVAQSHADLGIGATGPWRETITHCRQAIAALVGGAGDRVAFTQNTATGLALVINGLDWRQGDNVVVPAGEFPSNFYPWLHLRRKGIQIREVTMLDGHGDLTELRDSIDAHTRVVAVSAVQYSSGYRYDLARIGEACRAHDALLVVDGTQCVGALRMNVDADGVDVLAVSGHKWMLGPFGAGFTHFSERAMDQVSPSVVGWFSVAEPFAFDHEPTFAPDARRFESGTELAANIAGLSAAVDTVHEIGPNRVEQMILGRTEEIADALAQLGLTITRARSHAHWSGIVTATTGPDDADWHARLLDAGVRCSLRNGLRFAPHIFTNSDDITVVTDIFRAGLPR